MDFYLNQMIWEPRDTCSARTRVWGTSPWVSLTGQDPTWTQRSLERTKNMSIQPEKFRMSPNWGLKVRNNEGFLDLCTKIFNCFISVGDEWLKYFKDQIIYFRNKLNALLTMIQHCSIMGSLCGGFDMKSVLTILAKSEERPRPNSETQRAGCSVLAPNSAHPARWRANHSNSTQPRPLHYPGLCGHNGEC